MVGVVAPEAAPVALAWLAGRDVGAWRVGEVIPAAAAAGQRYVEEAMA